MNLHLRLKKTAFVGVFFLFLVLLTACDVKIGKKEPVTITIWHTYSEEMKALFDRYVAEFNATVGAREGFAISVTGVADTNVLHNRLVAAANKDPGAPELPDMAVVYPRVALILKNKDLLLDLGTKFSREDLADYVPEFIEEGKLGGEGLYLFPVAKSTEVLYVNMTFFIPFARDSGVDVSCFDTFEGIIAAGKKYKVWADAWMRDKIKEGPWFFYPDNLYNFAMIGAEQLGEHLFEGAAYNLTGQTFPRIWNTYCTPAAEGAVAISEGYGNYLAKSGKVLCCISSSAGSIFIPDSVNWPDNTKEEVYFRVFPYPVFEGGEKIALQRGGGIFVRKSTVEKENAAIAFLRWFTEPERNLNFVLGIGYMPVTKKAFAAIETSDAFDKIRNYVARQAIRTAVAMQKEYRFYYPPLFEKLEDMQSKFAKELRKAAYDYKEGVQKEDSEKALEQFRAKLQNP